MTGIAKLRDRSGVEVATVDYTMDIRQEVISSRTHGNEPEAVPRFKTARGSLVTKSGR